MIPSCEALVEDRHLSSKQTNVNQTEIEALETLPTCHV